MLHSPNNHSRFEHVASQAVKGGAAGAAAITLTPFIWGMFEPGSTYLQLTQSICGSGPSSGLSGVVQGIAQQVPMVGTYLATGGIFTGLLSLGVGLGGIALSRYAERQGYVTTAKVIRWASIATSVLVSLPALIPALSMGFHFLGAMLGPTSMLGNMAYDTFITLGKLGAEGAASAYAASGSSVLSSLGHFLACGLAAGSTAVVASTASSPKTEVHSAKHMHRLSLHMPSQLAT